MLGFVKNPTGSPLYLGKREGKDLVYIGKVDTGWSRTVSSQIRKLLDTMVSSSPSSQSQCDVGRALGNSGTSPPKSFCVRVLSGDCLGIGTRRL